MPCVVSQIRESAKWPTNRNNLKSSLHKSVRAVLHSNNSYYLIFQQSAAARLVQFQRSAQGYLVLPSLRLISPSHAVTGLLEHHQHHRHHITKTHPPLPSTPLHRQLILTTQGPYEHRSRIIERSITPILNRILCSLGGSFRPDKARGLKRTYPPPYRPSARISCKDLRSYDHTLTPP